MSFPERPEQTSDLRPPRGETVSQRHPPVESSAPQESSARLEINVAYLPFSSSHLLLDARSAHQFSKTISLVE